MALITEQLEIPSIAELMPKTRRWRKVRPCGTGAARRRHLRRGEPIDPACAGWHATALVSWRAGTGYKAAPWPR